MGQIILASASPRRKELLEQIGLEFEICPYFKEEFPFICFKGFYQASQEDESGRILVNHTEGVSQIINWTPQKRAAKTLEQWSNSWSTAWLPTGCQHRS